MEALRGETFPTVLSHPGAGRSTVINGGEWPVILLRCACPTRHLLFQDHPERPISPYAGSMPLTGLRQVSTSHN